MKRYESYKDSGVKWLGEIPGHWEVIRLKALLIERIEKNNNKENLIILSLLKDKGIIPYDEKGAIGNNSKEDLSQYKIARKGDLVINSMNVIIGSVGITQYDGYISPAYYSFKPRGIINLIYYYYLMTLRSVQQSIRCYSKGIMEIRLRITSNDFLSMPFPFPPKSEQTAIANYLDSVTSKIDKAISQQQKMIDLLNERKQIIIQNAVTKGLDPNAKMKDSGVEWIGEIPEDWEVRPIKTLLKLKKKLVGSKSNKYNLLSLSIDGIKIRDLNNPMGKFPTSFDTYQEVNKNDFVFCNFDNEETPRAVGLSKVHGMITGAYDVMALYDLRVDIEYLYLVFLDIDNFKKFKPLYKGLRKTVPYDSFMSYKIAIPPFEEQREISESLLVFLKNIDSSISQCNKMISLLQERKQIIINDVVTGKVKVI